MTTWTSQLTAQPGDFTPILSTITHGDGECLQAIYDALTDHATATGNTLSNNNTYTGSLTGQRYHANLNGVIYTGGQTLPGSSAGTTITGGQYS